jgi:transcriptional regulator with XRE-family HTH domain
MARRRSPRRIRIGIRIGDIVRTGREDLGLTKTALQRRTGISRQMIAAVEAARANPSLDILAALLDGLDMDLDFLAHGRAAIKPRRSHDAAHALCSAYVQRRLESAGWEVAREVRIEDGRYVGWIDLLAFHAESGTLLIIEIKTRIDDVGAIERSVDWHVRHARHPAQKRGWRPRRVIAWVLALATDEVEDELRRNRTLWATASPVRAHEMADGVRTPERLPDGRGLALIDPRSRRHEWLIRARVDGRRSAPPYRGYADFMGRVRRS